MNDCFIELEFAEGTVRKVMRESRAPRSEVRAMYLRLGAAVVTAKKEGTIGDVEAIEAVHGEIQMVSFVASAAH